MYESSGLDNVEHTLIVTFVGPVGDTQNSLVIQKMIYTIGTASAVSSSVLSTSDKIGIGVGIPSFAVTAIGVYTAYRQRRKKLEDNRGWIKEQALR